MIRYKLEITPSHEKEVKYVVEMIKEIIGSEESLVGPDIIFSIGGDGTFLKTAGKWRGVPILGINLGRLGYLADCRMTELKTVLEQIRDGKYTVTSRTAIESNQGLKALNEIALLKHDTASMIEIDVWLGDDYLTQYWADGLIISTPTGSTGYSLSVGGPIIDPSSDVMCIIPVAPHSLNLRPLIVSGENLKLRCKVGGRAESYILAHDGITQHLNYGEVEIKKSDPVLMIKTEYSPSWIETIKTKMNWGIK